MVPRWAILPAATQLIVQSFRHPNKDKVILVDEARHRVSVVPREEADLQDAQDTTAASH